MRTIHAWREREPGSHFTIAKTRDGCVDGDNQRLTARGLSSLDEISSKTPIRLDVELKPQWLGRNCRDLFDTGGRQRADDHCCAGRACSSGGFQFSFCVHQSMIRRGREDDWMIQSAAEELDFGVKVRNINERAGD